jgi:hypothetical protein
MMWEVEFFIAPIFQDENSNDLVPNAMLEK